MTDLRFENHGTVGLARPLTEAGRAFLRETAPEDAQFLGDAMAFKPRYLQGILDAALEYGLEVE
jgi:hypothetical protein